LRPLAAAGEPSATARMDGYRLSNRNAALAAVRYADSYWLMWCRLTPIEAQSLGHVSVLREAMRQPVFATR